ncbi:MAG: MFS transporter [Bacilli bacterium]
MVTATAIPTRRWSRVIPVAALMYTIAFIDRNNVSFAFSGMEKDLAFGATISGLVAGIFFIGYMFLQIPGGHIAARGSAKKFVLWTLLIWGLLAMATGLVQNLTELLTLRFLLGVAEGGVWPATLVLLSKWFPLSERARANSYWMMCIPLASIIMSPMSGWILQLANWRWLFFIEGALPWLWAIVWWRFMDDDPVQAKWISEVERNYILSELENDKKLVHSEATNYSVALRDKNVWLLVVYYFLVQVGFYGVSLWLPTLVKTLSHQGNVGVGYLSALPWIAALIGLYINSKHSDKTGERKLHASIPLILGAASLLVSVLIGEGHPLWSILFTVLAMGFIFAYDGVFWAIPAAILPRETLGGAMGLINGLGNLGGFFGPFIVGYFIASTGSFLIGVIFLAACLVAAAVLILAVRYKRIPTDTSGNSVRA